MTNRAPFPLLLLAALAAIRAVAQPAPDPWVAKNRVLVLTDIANEPDDQMSMVRFLVYSNEFDIEGLVASTSTWLRNNPRPDVILKVIDAYDQVRPNLIKYSPDYPTIDFLRKAVTTGQTSYGMAAVGPGHMSSGAERIIQAVDDGVRRNEPRPLWITAWGGVNTLAQALLHIQQTRSAADLATFISHLRVYTISDQDDAGPWIRRTFPSLFYIAIPSTQNGEEYYRATWTGISGDTYYHNGEGADFTTFTTPWVDVNIRAKGPLGKLYIKPCCIHEGDTPSFLSLINNGLDSFMSPAWGGWGGRYLWRQPYGESRPLWTQGGDSFPGRETSRDTVTGTDGKPHTSDQATIWRWRTAFQNDFAARMDWTVNDHGNHNPQVVVNGEAGKAPVIIHAEPGKPVTLDAAGTNDPDGDALTYHWFFYREAGRGNVTLDREDGPVVHATPGRPGAAHVILAVEDKGTPSLTAYRRVILQTAPR